MTQPATGPDPILSPGVRSGIKTSFLSLFKSQRQPGELSDASISILMESVQHLLLTFTRAMESCTSRLLMRITGFESGLVSFHLPDPVIGVDAGYGTCGSLTTAKLVRGNTRYVAAELEASSIVSKARRDSPQ